MAYKLIKLINGKIVTGEALKQILSETGFTIPTLPPHLMTYAELQALKPNVINYQPNTPENQLRYYADWNAWRFGVVVDYYARVQERETICKAFALVLRQNFLIGLVRRDGITLSTADRYLSFAMVLTELHAAWKFPQDKIDWICYAQIN